MQVADIQVHQPSPAQARSARRIERKFFIVPRNIGFAGTLLRQVCRRDSEYPQEQINSLYFDTPDLDQHVNSLSGELYKDKVRIRWYGGDGAQRDTVPIFLELKSREGFASIKQRHRLTVPAQNLALASLNNGIIPGSKLVDTMARFGHFFARPLRPVIKISYWRYRFAEIMTGTSVALDCRIRSTMIARELGYGERELELPGGVIEVKGISMELPATLRRLKIMDLDWSRYSKYSSCLDSHREEPGTVARLWPSGRTFEP